MTAKFLVGELVAIVRSADGKVLATGLIDKTSEKEIRTETSYEQLQDRRQDTCRRYWQTAEPHTERRIPREAKATRAPCFIRTATDLDVAAAQRRVEVRRAKERMPRNLRSKEEFERQIAYTEESLRRQRGPYENVLEQIRLDQMLIAKADD